MNRDIRSIQKKLLEIFSRNPLGFALAGGTALEMFYLEHRFSRDLDFFSPDYKEANIERLVDGFNQNTDMNFILENELTFPDRARVRFYTSESPKNITFKIDFVEDVYFQDPKWKDFDGIKVYDVKDIYYLKIIAVTGIDLSISQTGKELATGRNAPKDIYDIYCMSKKIIRLSDFLKTLPPQQQRGFIQWYRSFSRRDLKIKLLDIDIYDENFDSGEMIKYFDSEIKLFIERKLK